MMYFKRSLIFLVLQGTVTSQTDNNPVTYADCEDTIMEIIKKNQSRWTIEVRVKFGPRIKTVMAEESESGKRMKDALTKGAYSTLYWFYPWLLTADYAKSPEKRGLIISLEKDPSQSQTAGTALIVYLRSFPWSAATDKISPKKDDSPREKISTGVGIVKLVHAEARETSVSALHTFLSERNSLHDNITFERIRMALVETTTRKRKRVIRYVALPFRACDFRMTLESPVLKIVYYDEEFLTQETTGCEHVRAFELGSGKQKETHYARMHTKIVKNSALWKQFDSIEEGATLGNWIGPETPIKAKWLNGVVRVVSAERQGACANHKALPTTTQ